ncbi:MAG: cyclodeaminase/cyclohydrolase family protein [Erysipelotrichaceae bacterium]|nr:cyclodeaminase/cyclohydrolase family protein [Erysipelotrichaceae bacterium]
MMKMLDNNLREFTEALASSQPVPGGGGASSLAGCLAAALACMVGNLTVGKKKYEDSEEEMKQLIARADQLRLDLLEGIEKDAEAFYPLSQAYRMNKDDIRRNDILETCLANAAHAPAEILSKVSEVIDVLEAMLPISSRLAISDIATAAVLAEASLKGAAVNVRVNTALMQNRQIAESLDQAVEELVSVYSVKAENLFRQVMERM